MSSDPSIAAYQEYPYSGKKLIGAGVALYAIVWIASGPLKPREEPIWWPTALIVVLVIASLIYLLGYWKAVVAKGYPPVLFLAAFTGIIGLAIIMFLPPKVAN